MGFFQSDSKKKITKILIDCCRALLPALKEQKGIGIVNLLFFINISSINDSQFPHVHVCHGVKRLYKFVLEKSSIK